MCETDQSRTKDIQQRKSYAFVWLSFKKSIALALEAREVQNKLYFVLKSMGSTPRGPIGCTPEVDVIRN